MGHRTILLTFGVLRTLWPGILPLAPVGTTGLVVMIIADFLLLFSAGAHEFRSVLDPESCRSAPADRKPIRSRAPHPTANAVTFEA